ncbi:hypothetical protein BDC45DRAFT_564248 [Circinella umbellata]|nr:hypothetical protein BDC45DRAFT_564248 [Circinella umbellata]
MSRPSIEFFLHPPSPPRPEEPCVVLPPVSSLLRDAPLSPPPPSISANHLSLKQSTPPLPQISEPSPLLHSTTMAMTHHTTSDLVEPLPALTLSIPSPSSAFSSPATSPYPLDTPQSSPISSPHPGLLLPPPCNTRRSRSLSNASTSSNGSTFSLPCNTSPLFSSSPSPPPSTTTSTTRRLSDPPLYSAIDRYHYQHHNNNGPSMDSSWQRPQSASPSLPPATPSPPFVAKRKRGRPPNASRQVSQRDCYTFVTPTVWEVKQKQHINDKHYNNDNNNHHHHHDNSYNNVSMNNNDNNHSDGNMTVLLWPEEPRRTKGMNTFTSTRMDSTLSIPKKKRGRKPKVQLAGNSCFVWRDLTARRGANRKRKSSPASTTSTDEERLVDRVESIKLNSSNNTTPSSSPSPSSC